MKKLLLILFIVLCFGLVACADAQTTESTTTTESTSAVATTVSTTETTTATTETTTATTETTTETTTTETTVVPIPESFVEFDSNGSPIPSPDDKSCFDLVTREIKVEDIKALIKQDVSLKYFCDSLSLQCLRIYYSAMGYDGLRDVFYIFPMKTDDGWKIAAYYCWDGHTIFNCGFLFPFKVESKDSSSCAEMIENLKECGIIRAYPRLGGQRKETIYQLCDYFTLFYLNFAGKDKSGKTWTAFTRTHEYEGWCGRVFEIVCSQHISQIKNALRIKSSGADYCWSGKTADDTGVQIDMVIPSAEERTDYVCEIKFSENEYLITADYERSLLNKIEAFKISRNHKSSHSLLLVLITTLGLRDSIHNRAVNATISLEDLFT